ncbi:MAG: outer membrane beta-barrel protein [Verrucomicrobiota bacterium]|nr:outer membrane beta-barrel protein [Verrucomicrobiota bacterium]
MKRKLWKKQPGAKTRLAATGVCLGVIATGALPVHAQTATDAKTIAALEKQNQLLQQQLDILKSMAAKEGLLPGKTDPPVGAMTPVSLSGFVQASYFYNVDRPPGGYNAGYLWNTRDNSFSLNRVKITLASPPAKRSGTDWDAGYRVSLMAGENAPELNSGSGTTGFDYLREAYVDLNVPIGSGLNVKAGELISLLNFESGDGGAANPNFSQGYQWWYTGNGPSAGIQLDYAFTDWLDVKFRVDNGLYAGPVSSSNGKGFMGSIGLTPDSKTWIDLVGFGGEGQKTLDVDGGSILGGRQVTDKLGTAFEFDYFDFRPDGGSAKVLWSIGGWAWYDFTPEIGIAFRADYLDDKDGYGIKGGPIPAPGGTAATTAIGFASPETHGTLDSFTLTLNLKPTPNVKIQPEIRYDTTSYTDGFNGKDSQLILGCGATYLF